MSEIILREGIGPFERISPQEWNRIFSERAKFDGTLADLLLNNESTAVLHLDSSQVGNLGTDPENELMEYIKPLLLGVNYHNGHSEGDYKIVVQNIPERKGPYVLFSPPDSNVTTFHLQDMVFPDLDEPRFQESVANSLKIRSFYLHRGNPLQIFEDFRAKGFDFVDTRMDIAQYEKLLGQSYNARFQRK